jgi:hypothetical protein
MTKTEQKAEMTKEEFVDKVFPLYGSALDEFREEERKEFNTDLRSVIRGQINEFLRAERLAGHELDIDEFLNNNQ